ncbi:hypothetical protein Hanom_Chr15g01361501 [Helianthus anomalus]
MCWINSTKIYNIYTQSNCLFIRSVHHVFSLLISLTFDNPLLFTTSCSCFFFIFFFKCFNPRFITLG